MQSGSVPRPSRFFERPTGKRWSFPVIMAASGSGRPPGTYGLLTLGLLGLFSADVYATRRDSQTLSIQEREPSRKWAGESCRSHVVTEKQQSLWPWRATSESAQ